MSVSLVRGPSQNLALDDEASSLMRPPEHLSVRLIVKVAELYTFGLISRTYAYHRRHFPDKCCGSTASDS